MLWWRCELWDYKGGTHDPGSESVKSPWKWWLDESFKVIFILRESILQSCERRHPTWVGCIGGSAEVWRGRNWGCLWKIWAEQMLISCEVRVFSKLPLESTGHTSISNTSHACASKLQMTVACWARRSADSPSMAAGRGWSSIACPLHLSVEWKQATT